MNDCTPPQRLRCLAVWAGVTALSAALVLTVSGDLRPAPGAAFDRVLVAAAAWALCLAAAWASVVTGLVALEASRSASPARPGSTGISGVPAPVRRLVLRACGVALAGGLVAGTSGATATPGSLERPTTGSAHVARTGQVPQAPPPPVGPVSTGAVARVALAPQRVTSRPGDSLWRLAEAELRASTGRSPSDAEVAAYWPRIHETNRVLLGPDPDFLLPGVPIELPAATSLDKEQS